MLYYIAVDISCLLYLFSIPAKNQYRLYLTQHGSSEVEGIEKGKEWMQNKQNETIKITNKNDSVIHKLQSDLSEQ